jgi:hypothetical protein
MLLSIKHFVYYLCVLKKVFLKSWKANKMDRTDTIGLQEYVHALHSNEVIFVLVMLTQKGLPPTMEN